MSTGKVTDDDSEAAEISLAAQCVRALLDRHGLPRHKHSQTLVALTGLSNSQAHRKLNSKAPWSLEELRRVAEHFGESLPELCELTGSEAAHEAKLAVGAVRMPCQVWLGNPLDDAHSAPLVAMESPAGWVVVPQSEAGSQPGHEIRRLVARPSAEQSRRVAVLDQDREAADSLAEQLKAAGLQTQAFYLAESLVAADSAQPFDGYVLDWLLGSAAGRALIRTIRSRDAQCPIVVFSGELGSKLVDERDVAEALTTYGLLFHEKPMRAMIVAADLARAFAALQ